MEPDPVDPPVPEPILQQIELDEARTSISAQLEDRVPVAPAAAIRPSPTDLLGNREALIALLVLAVLITIGTSALVGLLIDPLAGLLAGLVAFPMSAATLAIAPSSRRKRVKARYSVSSLAAWSRDGRYLAAEGHIVLLAARMSDSIVNHPVWQSEWLDHQRIRMNPSEELRQIADRAMRLRQLRLELGPRPSSASANKSVSAVYDRQCAALDLVENALRDRLTAIFAYLNQLDRLTPLLDAMNSVKRMDSLADRINELVGQTITDEMATREVTNLRHELTEIAASIQAVLQWLGTPPAQLPLR